MLSISSLIFCTSKVCGEKSNEKTACCVSTTVLEAIAGIILLTIGALALSGKMTPFCSSAGSSAMIGVGAFSAVPLIIASLVIFRCKCKDNAN